MAIKRKGVLARPGEYKYGDRVEVKTAEELRAAAERQPILILTCGHPKSGLPTASQYIGTVTQKWNQEKELVEGDFWFYDEYVPDHIREKIVNGEPVPISAGFTLESVEDGVQRGLLYTHIAVLDGENPICPLGQCGINVRAEAEEILMRYEQESELTDPNAPSAPAAETPPAEKSEVESLRGEIAELKELVRALTQTKKTEPAVQKAEDETPTATTPASEEEETVPPAATPAPIVPERVIPRSTAPPEAKDRFEWDDGEVATGDMILGAKKEK